MAALLPLREIDEKLYPMGGGMNSGYDEFRRRNDEMNQRAREESQRQRDRQDAERRHREHISAMAASSPRQAQVTPSAPPLKLTAGAILLILCIALVMIAGAFILKTVQPTNSAKFPADPGDPAEIFAGGREGGPPSATNAESGSLENDREGRPETSDRTAEVDPATDAVGTAPEEGIPQPEAPFFAEPSGRQVERATLKALERGEPVIWRADGNKGYVLVSAAQTYPDRICRHVTYSSFEDDQRSISEPVLWCRAGGGEWSK